MMAKMKIGKRVECGKRFFQKRHSGCKNKGVFCSHRCSAKHSIARINAGREKRYPRCVVKFDSCRVCSVLFSYSAYRNVGGYYCSDLCKQKYREQKRRPKISGPCVDCRKLITGNANKRRCAVCARKRIGRFRKHRQRARKYGVLFEVIHPSDVFERDRWICQICGVRTPKRLRGTF